jgi:hypothetical protein
MGNFLMISHMVIPDIQAKPGVSLDYLKWIGEYIVAKKPDILICIGDFADMPSLSSYDKGKKSFEGRRYKADIAAAKEAMDLMLAPMREYNKRQKENHHVQYKPRMVLTLGNHEERIMRVSEYSPELDGVVSYADLPYEDWEVIDYLKPIKIDGVVYVHFLANPFTGKPMGGCALNQLKLFGKSYIVGHKQTLDIATRFAGDGEQQWGIVAGAAYPHDEDYKGHQGNLHWRGVLYLHRVQNGTFDPMFISLDYLKDRYNHE